MSWQQIYSNLPRIVAIVLALGVIFWCSGCPATVTSPVDPAKDLTRAELQLELDALLAQYEHRLTVLDQEERLRKLLLTNSLSMVQAGSIDPMGILTSLFAFYGVGSVVQSSGKAIIKKAKKT